MQRPGAVQLCSYAPDLTQPRWLGAIGNVAGLTYSDSMPGGNDTLQCTLQMRPGQPDSAIEPGRIIRAYQGARWIWEGILAAPAPSDQGWQLTAQGAGHYGENYVAIDSGGGCVEPSAANVDNATYKPLARPLFIYPSKAALARPEFAAFVQYYLDNVNNFVDETGYIEAHADVLSKSKADLAAALK